MANQGQNEKVLALKKRLVEKDKIVGKESLNVQIQTVSTCNAKCAFCPYQGSWHQKNPGKMEDQVFKNIVQSLKKYKIGRFCPYLQNEPLLDKDIFEKVKYINDELKPEYFEISTNLKILKDDMLQKLIECLSVVPHQLIISFHGIDKETYEDIMGPKYERTLENVHKIMEAAQKYPLKVVLKGGGKPRQDEAHMKKWFGREEYEKFWEKTLSSYEKKPKLLYFTYHDRAGQQQMKAKNMSFKKFERKELDDFYCHRFERWIHILYTGEPILCCMDYNRETVFPFSAKTNTVPDMYDSPFYNELIRKCSGMIDTPAEFICKRCISPGG